MADWSVTPSDPAPLRLPGWWVEVPAADVLSQTGWWEVTAQLLAATFGTATGAMSAPTVTAGVRLAPTAAAVSAELAAPGLRVALTIPAAAAATAAMAAPVVTGAATVTATPMEATAAPAAPAYNLNYSAGGGFPYTFNFELDSTFTAETFDYEFDFALG